MNAVTPTNREKSSPITGRIGAKLRKALVIMAQEGTTKREAARRAGMNETSLGKALRKPYVANELATLKAAVTSEIEGLRGIYKALALEHARYLMKNAKSEAVQARMVEFLAGESKPGPSVTVNVNQNAGSGYEFVRPGQVVEIIDAEVVPPDSISEAQSSQNTEE